MILRAEKHWPLMINLLKFLNQDIYHYPLKDLPMSFPWIVEISRDNDYFPTFKYWVPDFSDFSLPRESNRPFPLIVVVWPAVFPRLMPQHLLGQWFLNRRNPSRMAWSGLPTVELFLLTVAF